MPFIFQAVTEGGRSGAETYGPLPNAASQGILPGLRSFIVIRPETFFLFALIDMLQ